MPSQFIQFMNALSFSYYFIRINKLLNTIKIDLLITCTIEINITTSLSYIFKE